MPLRSVVLVLSAALAVLPGRADEFDALSNVPPPGASLPRGTHSDFFDDPLGRFMDLLAEGAIPEARALRPEACAAWHARRGSSSLSGLFWVGGTKLSLDVICAARP